MAVLVACALQEPPPAETTFEVFREFTGWKRPGHAHGCPPVEIVPGLWTAAYHDIDSKEKLQSLNVTEAYGPIRLVVNSATCQCTTRTGSYGDGVKVLPIDLEDDPDARKAFDGGKTAQSTCTNASVPLLKRCAGDAKKDFERVSKEIEATNKVGGTAIVHCKASISRSVAFLLAHLMRTRGISLMEAGALVKAKWDATWPCDRFVYQLLEYEKELARPVRLTKLQLFAVIICSAIAGMVLTTRSLS
jgi:protein-tyrosine phosphatase